MSSVKCPKFENCGAVLCPMDKKSMEYGIFYSDEDICNRKDFQTLTWIKRQKTIAKLKLSTDTYYTVSMLKAIKRLSKSIEGIDPDLPLDKAKEAEGKWVEGRQNNGFKQSKIRNKTEITRVGNRVRGNLRPPLHTNKNARSGNYKRRAK